MSYPAPASRPPPRQPPYQDPPQSRRPPPNDYDYNGDYQQGWNGHSSSSGGYDAYQDGTNGYDQYSPHSPYDEQYQASYDANGHWDSNYDGGMHDSNGYAQSYDDYGEHPRQRRPSAADKGYRPGPQGPPHARPPPGRGGPGPRPGGRPPPNGAPPMNGHGQRPPRDPRDPRDPRSRRGPPRDPRKMRSPTSPDDPRGWDGHRQPDRGYSGEERPPPPDARGAPRPYPPPGQRRRHSDEMRRKPPSSDVYESMGGDYDQSQMSSGGIPAKPLPPFHPSHPHDPYQRPGTATGVRVPPRIQPVASQSRTQPATPVDGVYEQTMSPLAMDSPSWQENVSPVTYPGPGGQIYLPARPGTAPGRRHQAAPSEEMPAFENITKTDNAPLHTSPKADESNINSTSYFPSGAAEPPHAFEMPGDEPDPNSIPNGPPVRSQTMPYESQEHAPPRRNMTMNEYGPGRGPGPRGRGGPPPNRGGPSGRPPPPHGHSDFGPGGPRPRGDSHAGYPTPNGPPGDSRRGARPQGPAPNGNGQTRSPPNGMGPTGSENPPRPSTSAGTRADGGRPPPNQNQESAETQRKSDPDALPHHPTPVRPGLMQNGTDSARKKPPPVRNHSEGSRDVVAAEQSAKDNTPLTLEELSRIRDVARQNPEDPKSQLFLAKKLAEASRTLIDDGGRADAKMMASNQERYTKEAQGILKKLVANSYPDAMFFMADCCGEGSLGYKSDSREAFTLYQSAAKLGHAASAYRTAVCCEIGPEEGGGTKKDTQKAIQWYKRASSLGDVPATYKMGIILLKGLMGQEKNQSEALTYLKRAAERADEENPHAVHELGLLYESPNNAMMKDDSQALQYFTKAAKLGYKFSQFKLGQAYEYGLLGCTVDARNSIIWYTRAAAQGEHQSELALSGWYLTGSEGILEHSDTEAYLWARKAANADPPVPKAMFAMGYFTEVGIGCPRSLEEAKRWYARAAANKFPKAQERLEELRKGGQQARKMPEKISRNNPQKQSDESCVLM